MLLDGEASATLMGTAPATGNTMLSLLNMTAENGFALKTADGSVDLFAFRTSNMEIASLEIGVEQSGLTSRCRLDRPEERLPTGRKGFPWFLSTAFS